MDADLKDEGAGWHVITGKHFAASVTSQVAHYVFLDLTEIHQSFLLFKTQ
eukprot:CAMPEP_0168326760 /NCGR_PEP_ID=MMETSP0213-20121227/5500_1 /TAXON_ID=151035 /ORGANISM="Euplotes harpa, Strain FSP1.4" /LENGTH=49 /DNA_ID=CAMNT_0008329547 /DNA_START=226 /DNA_END=375 /DNA_ORIENTATION=+